MSARSGSHVDALIQRYAPGKSIKELERTNDLAMGALANHLKPANRGRFPRLNVLERFANVLGVPLNEVSAAFAADAEMALTMDPLPEHVQQLIDDYLALDNADQALVRTIVHSFRHRPETERLDT